MQDASGVGRYSLSIIALVLVGMVMYVARPVLMPFMLGCFLAITIEPALTWLSRYLSRWLALLAVLVLLAVAIVGGSALFVTDVVALAARAPYYAQNMRSLVDGALNFAQEHGLNISLDQLGTGDSLAWAFDFLTAGLQSVMGVLAETFLVLFIMVFLVLEAEEFRRKIACSFTDDTTDMVLDSIDSIVSRIQTYMITKTVISLATGLCTSIVTLLLGIEFPLLWGILAFVLNFVPNVGSTIAVIPPVIVAMLQGESLTMAMLTFLGLGSVQMTIGNIIEPRVMGRSLNLSTLVVFVSMVFWGWMWGMIGVILAVPLTAAIKIICEHIEALRPVAIMLGERYEDLPDDVPMLSAASLPAIRSVGRSSAQLSAVIREETRHHEARNSEPRVAVGARSLLAREEAAPVCAPITPAIARSVGEAPVVPIARLSDAQVAEGAGVRALTGADARGGPQALVTGLSSVHLPAPRAAGEAVTPVFDSAPASIIDSTPASAPAPIVDSANATPEPER